MKRALFCVLATACSVRLGLAGGVPKSDLTVVLDFKGPHTVRSVAEMQLEAQRILKQAGVRLDWSMAQDASHYTFSDLVVVKFNGACVIRPDSTLYGELGPPLGPLAFTYETDREVQPFSEVACDKVAASVRSAMWGGDFAKADLLLGRALGRVLVHEIVHILTGSGAHGRDGVEQPALSGKQLIAKSLPLSSADLERLTHRLATR